MGPFQDGWTVDQVERVIAEGDPEQLLYVPIVISMDPPERAWAQDVCVALSGHPHFNVRGNAILAFGHLARVCGELDESVVRPIVLRALTDEHEFVRGHAESAVEDIEMFLGWQIQGE